MQPYSPFAAAMRFQLTGLPGSRSLEWRKTRPHLEDTAEAAIGEPARDRLAARVERKLRRAAHEQPRRDRPVDRRVRGQVDPERLLAEQVLARLEHGDVDLLVQVVRHGAVDRFDLVVGEELGQ